MLISGRVHVNTLTLTFGHHLRHERQVSSARCGVGKAGTGARPWAVSAKNAKRLRKWHRVGATGPVTPTRSRVRKTLVPELCGKM